MTAEQFENEFAEFRDALRSFIYRLTANRDDMEDLAQDTYEKALRNLAGFEGRSALKTWVFSIALNLCRDHLKKQKRWKEDFQDQCRTATLESREIQGDMIEIARNSPQGRFLIKEHIDYCFTCLAKTRSLEEQVCVILKEMYAFKVREITLVTELTEGQVKYHLSKARESLKRIFDERCSLIKKEGACWQCSELNGMFNPQQSAEEQLRKIEMAQRAGQADTEALLDLRFRLVEGIDPLKAEGFDFHNYMLENVPRHAK